MSIGDKECLINELIEANFKRSNLQKFKIEKSTSDAHSLSNLCNELTYKVLYRDSVSESDWDLMSKSVEIVICSDLSKQNRIYILDADKTEIDEFMFCLSLMMASSQRTLFGMRDIRRSILLTESEAFFSRLENVEKWKLIIEQSAVASAFDITLGQLHIPAL